MVWHGVCSKGVTLLGILDQETVDHVEYIEKVLLIAFVYGDDTFGEHWTFLQDGAKPDVHHLSQK